MQQIKLTRGLDVKLDGKAALTDGSVMKPAVYHIVPDHFAGIKPRLLVHEGDKVKAGSPLFQDKTFAEMLFTSPVSGKVSAIVRGERRKVLSIDIEADATMQYEAFDTKQDLKALLLQSGLWALIKQRPYDCIALPNKTPKAVFISSFDSAPLAPDYDFVLQGHEAEVQAAITALGAIAPVFMGIKAGARAPWKDCTLYMVDGPHPAGNVGVQINHVAPIAKGETVWTINIQDLRLIGKLLTKGIVDMRKRVALTGPLVREPKYYDVIAGMPVKAILACNVDESIEPRHIAGNALSGHQITLEDAISLYDNQFTVIAQGTETHEFMGWIMPCFLREGKQDARLKGGRRAIIVSGEYERVFPMDIYPEHLIKAMIAGNLDRMEALGAYEVAPEDFAVCEYVCTSKMPLQAIVRAALDNLKQEIE